MSLAGLTWPCSPVRPRKVGRTCGTTPGSSTSGHRSGRNRALQPAPPGDADRKPPARDLSVRRAAAAGPRDPRVEIGSGVCHRACRTGGRAGTAGAGLHDGLPPVFRVHVPGPGGSVRVVVVPLYDPALAAADRAIRVRFDPDAAP